ncbi:MAG: diacylglycerol kinase family protein [Clostridia bacterium]|nr:diacylglycerol kinase family protein [Clostridia bacterium]
MKCQIIYNLKAGYLTKKEDVDAIEGYLKDKYEDIVYNDVYGIESYENFFSLIDKDDVVIICGGDGTLNKFINRTDGVQYENRIYYYPIGTGNDFATDMGKTRGCEPFEITRQLKDLPKVTVKGKSYKFINGVGYGIDGYCCQVGDELKKTSKKPINYAGIAIKGLLFHYKPTNATVIVDGSEHSYKNVWLAPCMKGKYYGGGMIPIPDQKRTNPHLSVMLWTGWEKLSTLIIFPSIFKGEHAKHKKRIHIFSGKSITVRFDRPVALQIDGETILDVTEYTCEY